jgi:hypothetical protein
MNEPSITIGEVCDLYEETLVWWIRSKELRSPLSMADLGELKLLLKLLLDRLKAQALRNQNNSESKGGE